MHPDMKITYNGLILIFFAVFLLSVYGSDIVYGKQLTMEESINRALSKNNQIKASEFGLKKAQWDKRNAWTNLFPSLSLSSRFIRIDDQTFAERDFSRYFRDVPPIPGIPSFDIPQTVFQESYYTEFNISMPVFNGMLLNNLWTARASEKMAFYLNKSTRDNIIFQVISTYLNVLRSRDILKLQQDYLELSRLNFEKAERLYNAGRYSKSDVLRWKVDYQQQKSQVVNNESTLRSMRTILGRLINLDIGDDTQVEDQIPDFIELKATQLSNMLNEEILNLIKLDDKALVQANAALAAAKSSENISKSLYRNTYMNYLPNITVSYSYGWRENNTIALDDYSPRTWLVNLSMPIFTSFQNITSTKSSYYSYKQSQEQFNDDLKNTRYILTEIVNKIINLKTQRELSKTNVEFSEHNYRVVEQQKEKGLISNIDFIDAKLNLQNAKLNDISTEYDFISAMVELNYLTGKIDNIITQ